MKKDKAFIFTLILLITSCVTTSNKLPNWAEIKPVNTDREIFFVYGPVESRNRAKEGLYKEISEYFGVKVSSVDKFVKQVTFENGERDISQTKESQVDVTSREKGLNSIEILEIWSDNSGKKWCVLASINKNAEKEIREQVEAEIEAERVIAVLVQAEGFSKAAENVYNVIEDRISELTKLKIRMELSIEKISGMGISSEIMTQSRMGIVLGEKISSLIKEIRRLTSKIKIINKKNSSLKNQLENNDIAYIELDFFIKQSMGFLTKSEVRAVDVEKSEMDISGLKDELNSLYLKSELELSGDEESRKSILKNQLLNIDLNSSKILALKDDMELLYSQSEDILRELKQVSFSTSLDKHDKIEKVRNLLVDLEIGVNNSRKSVDSAFRFKSSINLDSKSALSSEFITDEQIYEIKKSVGKINSPVSWIEIYKDKILANNNSGKGIVDNLLVKDLIHIRFEEFTTNLLDRVGEGIDLTIGEFTIEDTSISSSFSGYIKSSLFSIMANRDSFKIVDYDSVTEFLSGKNINPSMIYSGTTATNIMVKHIIYGNYWFRSGDVELKISLKNIDDNAVIYSETILFPKASIPAEVNLKPRNFNKIVELDKNLSDSSENRGFEVWPDKGSGSTYRDGESMVINVYSPVSGYVKIYHISAENELTLVFPNKFDRDNSFDAGKNYTIGDSSYPFRFKLGKPYGTESLRALFSEKQFPDIEDRRYIDDFLYSGIRGINIEKRINMDLDIGSAVTNSYYTIVE